MESTGNSYSSVHMRERDKILEEKHKKELAIVERKIDKLKWSNSDVLKQLFEMQTRANRLAKNLGFYDIYEAQVYVDNADIEMSYKECFESISSLKEEVSAEKKESERLREQLRLVEEERDQLKAEAATADHKQRAELSKYKKLSKTLSGQVEQLQSRYDALVEVKERAAARYKLDYDKWKKVKNWMFSQKGESAGKELSEEERKQREIARVMMKRDILVELGLESVLRDAFEDEPLDPLPAPIMDCESDKENQTTPTVEGGKRWLTEPPSPLSHHLPLSPTMVEPAKKKLSSTSTALQSLRMNTGPHPAPSCSPSILFDAPTASTRIPLAFRPVLHVGPPVKQEVGSSPLSSNSRPLKRQHIGGMHAASSDTEDDSQAVGIFPAPTAGFKAPEPPSTIRRRFPIPVPTGSSDTEAESQSQMFPIFTPRGPPARPKQPSTAPMPSKAALPQPDGRRRSDIGVVSRDAETLQPLKMRRLSGNELAEQPTSTPQGRSAAHPTSKSAGKQKAVEPPVSTPRTLITAGQKRINDYSAFKGRGRYAKDLGSTNKSINATYAIDPAQNGGLDFRYDEVVRGKDDRKKMDAGDCECCRDYYEAVGPLPNRLQQPLWRSPVNSPAKPCPRHQHSHASGSGNAASTDRQSEIDSHKQAISRHRHHWARANTPPGYWNIGFPDTQEAENINEKAREMHNQKRAEVEDAVKRGDGRYKKR